MEKKYYWIRIYDYNFERDLTEKGTLLDEFYLKDITNGRDGVKEEIKLRYDEDLLKNLKYAKPRKKDGIYAIVMDSTKFFYDRFYVTINTLCFNCYKKIEGKASEFPRVNIEKDNNSLFTLEDLSNLDNTAYFCKYECKRSFHNKLNPHNEGEFQDREEGKDGSTFGYIYEIYNRVEDKYYVGQTRYLPFFRWQEHVKDGSKGDISDLSFRIIAEINKTYNNDIDQSYMNNLEGWWIQKYIAENKNVFNLTVPRITIFDLKEKFKQMVRTCES